MEPSVKHCTKLRDWVGLRPGRPEVRLEREMIDGVSVVHNYGHGGSGITVFQVTFCYTLNKKIKAVTYSFIGMCSRCCPIGPGGFN